MKAEHVTDILRFHDFHLRGYSVTDFGVRIELDLVYDYPGTAKEQSLITFTDVACYSFVHPTGAIIIDIGELPVAILVAEEQAFFTEQSRRLGIRYWRRASGLANSMAEYISSLTASGFRAWRISSAIGFDGFVIAKSVAGHVVDLSKQNAAAV